MRQSFRLPSWVISALFLIGTLINTTVVSAQNADGFTLQETPGLALVKPQPWSKLSDATVLEFEAFIDRTSTGGAGSGYYEFHSRGGNKRQIPAGRVVKVVVYPDPARIKTLIGPKERAEVQASIGEITEVITTFPATKVQLTPPLKALAGELKKFDAGQIKTDGIWVARKDYISAQAKKLTRLLKADIANANPPDSFEMKIDPKYVALVEFSQSDPSLKPLVSELLADYTDRVRVEKRGQLLATLADPTLTTAKATATVAELRTLKPETDPASAAYLKSWDAALATVKTSNAQADKLATSLETEMAAVPADNPQPKLSPALEQGLADLSRTMLVFKATTPPAPLLADAQKTLAVCALGEGLKECASLFEENQFLQAQDLLSNLTSQAVLIGPQTTRVLGELQKTASLKINEFTRLREQAKLLTDSNKAAEALAMYEQAFAVIPDSTVSAEIEKLKAIVPPAQ